MPRPFIDARGPTRRSFLRAAAGSALALASSPLPAALADTPAGDTEFFVFIHASGGWDVTLWADPRNEKRGLVDPATTDNTDVSQLRRWVDAPHDGDVKSFAPVRPSGSNLTFGPGIGDLAEVFDRLTVINGLSMNLAGGRDHYPCNSALVISPRFRGNLAFGRSDPDQLLPARARRFSDGERPIAPPDLLATFISAFGVPPRRYMRDGEVVPELLRS